MVGTVCMIHASSSWQRAKSNPAVLLRLYTPGSVIVDLITVVKTDETQREEKKHLVGSFC